MHQVPPLRVSRPVSACSRCRSAKIKCDGKLPACSACERAGKAAECSSGSDEFARGKERSYVAALETKIERLERQISSRKSFDQNTARLVGATSAPNTTSELTALKTAEAGDVNELVSDFGYLAVHATSNGYHGFDNEMSLARLIKSIAIHADLPVATGYPLPTRLVALELTEACIKEFFSLWPVMSYAAAAGALERVYHRSQRLASSGDRWNVRLFIALGLCTKCQRKGDASFESAIRHVSIALHEYGEDVIVPGSIERLQGFILLVLFSTVNSTCFESWYLVGMATRFMVEMGLHTSDNKGGMGSTIFEEGRRLFHIVYALDRFISMSQQRPCSFSDDSVDRTMPPKYTPSDIHTGQLFLSDAPEDFAKIFTSLLQCQSKLYYDLYHSGSPVSASRWSDRLDLLSDHGCRVSKLQRPVIASLQARYSAQIFYVSVLILLPYPDSPMTTSQSDQGLVIENVEGYVSSMTSIASTSEFMKQSRVQDLQRSIAVGARLMALCERFMSNSQEENAYVVGDAFQEIQRQSTEWSNTMLVRKMTDLLYRLDDVLSTLVERFEQPSTYTMWKEEFDRILYRLQEGRSMYT